MPSALIDRAGGMDVKGQRSSERVATPRTEIDSLVDDIMLRRPGVRKKPLSPKNTRLGIAHKATSEENGAGCDKRYGGAP